MSRAARILTAGLLLLVLPAACFAQALVVNYAPGARPPVRDYRFRPDLSDGAGAGPALAVPDGAGSLIFEQGQGPRLDAVGVTDHYTLELVFQFQEVSGYRKVVDFKNRQADTGLYVYSGQLVFYGAPSREFGPGERGAGPAVIALPEDLRAQLPSPGEPFLPNTEYVVRLERDRGSRLVRAYLDDRQALDFVDEAGLAVFDIPVAHFFTDDETTGGREASAGRVSRIRVWDAPGGAGGFAFEQGEGVRLEQVGVTDHYTIEIAFQLEEVAGYRKLLDFKNLAADQGLYVNNGHLVFYGALSAPPVARRADPFERPVATAGPIQPNTAYTVRLERDQESRTVRGYLGGDTLAFEFVDEENLAVFDGPVAHFFSDDEATSGGEASAGRVTRIRVWDAPGAAVRRW